MVTELTPEIIQALAPQWGYRDVRVIPGRGICALQYFMYTVGITYGHDGTGYSGRWCYPNMAEAKVAYDKWDGVGDPSGEWIKYKGVGGERSRIPDPYDD